MTHDTTTERDNMYMPPTQCPDCGAGAVGCQKGPRNWYVRCARDCGWESDVGDA